MLHCDLHVSGFVQDKVGDKGVRSPRGKAADEQTGYGSGGFPLEGGGGGGGAQQTDLDDPVHLADEPGQLPSAAPGAPDAAAAVSRARLNRP